MPTATYVHYDVFTSRPFEGNQLAVFPDAGGLSSAEMQALANEMNFAESTFVLPAETDGTDVRMRIFTPGREMPMAGHPTIGTTFALVDSGVIAAGRERWVFGLNVGPTPVALEWRDGGLARAWMDQGRPEFRTALVPGEAVVAAVRADRAAWTATGLPIEEASCGAAFFYVPLATRTAVDACAPDDGALRALASAFGGAHIGLFVFSAEPGADGATVYARMFAPEAGVVEDPATGGATGPLAAYLVRHGVVAMTSRGDIVSVQGVKMGRP
ncbi:MAG TPA: PhzF family phenazine biosynthesis protein, partial [Vicinamibacterales bacterium]|nr:PhzF family phenazine biosynthesis protein [Vicinamibacterales bacterium]